jgi:hypothetical protein
MKESTARKRLLRLFKEAGVPAIPVENTSWPGTPDIAYPEGWIEVKTIENCNLPKRITTPIRIDHFTAQQRHFAYWWTKGEGRCYMVLVLGKLWLLLDGEYYWQSFGRHTIEEIRENALLESHHIFDPQEFLEEIR